MASYRVEFKRSAEQDIRRLSRTNISRVMSRIEALAEDPFPVQSLRLTGSERLHRVRLGSYRIIYEVDGASSVISVHYVRHRRDAYRDLNRR